MSVNFEDSRESAPVSGSPLGRSKLEQSIDGNVLFQLPFVFSGTVDEKSPINLVACFALYL